MNYINYKCPTTGTVETVEDLRDLPRGERKRRVNEYRLVSPAYYVSQRATKDYHKEEDAN